MSDALTVTDAASAIEAVMDDRGLMPSDEDYSDPVAETEEKKTDEPGVEDQEATEEPEGDPEVSEEGGEEEVEADEADDKSSENPEQLFDLTIGDEEYEVNLEELKGGYLRNEDYLKKLNELDQEYDTKVEALEQKQAELLALYEQATADAATQLGQFRNINWDQLKATDPENYQRYRLAVLEAEDQARAQAKKRNDLFQAHQKAEEIKYQAYLGKQMELAKKIVPDFGTQEFTQGMMKYGKDIGFTEDELNGIADARHLLVMDKARRYDELMSKRKVGAEVKASKELPPVVKPGAPKAAGQEERSKVKAARAQLGKTGSVQDAAALFLARGTFDN